MVLFIILYNLVLYVTFNFVDVELRAFLCFRAKGVKTKNTLTYVRTSLRHYLRKSRKIDNI